MSINISKDSNPQCDAMNHTCMSDDFTLSLSVQCPIDEFPIESKEKIVKIYPLFVPICIVACMRKALLQHAPRMNAFDKHITCNPTEHQGITKKFPS